VRPVSQRDRVCGPSTGRLAAVKRTLIILPPVEEHRFEFAQIVDDIGERGENLA
jgi:hypothetical protein